MAERNDNRTELDKSSEETCQKEEEAIPDCPVCLQTCSYPVKLACGHIFCFLCIKGVVFRSKRCALCRQDVDLDYFKHPVVVKSKNTMVSTSGEGAADDHGDNEGYQWYYEGRNGWWQYDDASSAELEKAHKENKRSCELLIAGFLYFVDFENMVQFRKTEPGRRRRIKRDLGDAEKKGVAGLRIECESRSVSTSSNVVPSRQATPNSRANEGSVPTRSSNHPNDSDQCNDSQTLADRVERLPIERLVVGSSSDDEQPSLPSKNTTG